MGAVTIAQMADRVASLMGERLSVPGNGLEEKLRRGGRRLPHRVREAAENLAVAALKAQNAKLLMQVDEAAVARDYDICVRHLSRLNRGARLRAAFESVAASIAISLLVVGAGLVGFLIWRGHI